MFNETVIIYSHSLLQADAAVLNENAYFCRETSSRGRTMLLKSESQNWCRVPVPGFGACGAFVRTAELDVAYSVSTVY